MRTIGDREVDRARGTVVFPGQSSRDEGMRDLVEEWRPELLDTLSGVVEDDDPFTQAAPSLAAEQAVTVCCSLAYWHALGRPLPRFLVGHSLGELSALVAAGSVSEHDAVRLAATRGSLMQRACEARPGGMMAVRAPLFEIEQIAVECDVFVAYHNAPRRVVLSGARDGIERVRAELQERGIRCTSLELAGAFNSPLMEPAVAPFRAELEDCEVRPPHAVVYSATTCRPMIDVRAEVARNLVSPVRWWETLARLAMQGIDTFVEVRVGGLLSPLPAAIVTERAPRSSRAASRRSPSADAGLLAEMLAAAPGAVDSSESVPSADALFAYRDEQNRLHVLA
jgi:[acyl-carrier-protein] S-malonyltransferase